MSFPLLRLRIALFVLVTAFLVFAVSCASAPQPAPENLSVAELIQRAQDAYDRDNFEQAVVFYQAIRERFPTDQSAQCAADYEIAFIRYKQKRLDEAREGFRALLARYQGPDAALLPSHYRVLGEKILAKIELEK